jgi:hypothetical protein
MIVGAVGLIAGLLWTEAMTRPMIWRRRSPRDDYYDYAP